MMIGYNNIITKILLLVALCMTSVQVAWGDTWNGTTTTDLTKQSHNSGKDGKTEATAWEINTAGEFAWFMNKVATGNAASASKTYGNKYWKLTADIDLNNKEWNAYGSSTSVFLGHFDGDGHTISNMTIEPVTKKKTYSGLFGNISGTSNTVRSEVKNLTIASSSFDPTAGFSGKSCGFLCGYSRYADITNVTVTGCAFNTGTNLLSGTNHIGGVVGQVNIGVILRNCTVSGFTFGCAAKVKGLNLGGIAGYCNASSTLPTTIAGCSVNTPTFTIGTDTTVNELNGCNIGGLLGSCGAGVNIYDNKVTTPQMTIYAKVTSASYIAGGIGMTANYTTIDGLHISGGYIKDALISGASDFIPITANTEFVVAGAISKVNSGGTASGAANVVKNVAVTGMKFDLPHHNVATGITSTNKFVVGAVMGYISDPKVDASKRCAIPENIVSKGVTLYAPYAITSAVVGTSGTAAGIDNYHDDGRGDIDQIQKSQHDTWFYSDYKLGLSNDVLTNSNIIECNAATEQTAKVERNYLASSVETNTDASISAPKLLNMTGTTFQHKPGYSDHEFDGGTVLWWNQSGGTANDNTQQGFYPLDGNTGRLCTASCGSGGSYPYFMYFFQGVNHGTYVEPTVAENIIAGIDANYTLMTGNTALTTPTVLTISDPDGTAKKRGFDAHVISVTASDGGSYTYKWYVNGVEQTDSVKADGLHVRPDWRYSKSIMVIATPQGGTGGASASYTLRHGVLKTKNFEDTETDYVGMSYLERGTSDNPYIIDCPEALKQWSYLSTYCTSYNYEGVTNDNNTGRTVAFNQSYFELGADIDLGNEELIPISHCGWSQDGTRGTINQNFVFCGHFEGNGHTIKNFKIKWKGATINSGGKYIYYGLFGALGWGDAAATQSCVVQNLILENGHIVHDNTNHSLYYEGTTHSNNVCIGMLAGIASQYTTVRNVELRNCSIDDNEDTEDYYLAGAQFTVGGMIGRIQGSITANNLDFGSTIVTDFLSSNCDITLKHAVYKSESPTEYETNSLVRLFTVGGVIGSIYSTLAAFSASNMPQYIYYTGKIDARRAFVAPAFASADYSGITGNNYEDYWKHYMVNATENATQEIPNLYYGTFQIQDYSSSDDGTTQTINNSYPASTCSADGGSRTIIAHNNSHPNNYNFYTGNNNYYGAYQGVNYGTFVTSGDRAALELEIAAAKTSLEEISMWYLVFDGDKLILTDHMPEKLSLQDLVSGNTHTVTVINTAADADAYTYEWYINGVKSETIATTTRSVDFTTGATPQLIYVKAIKDGNEKKTDVVDIPRSITSISASYTPVREQDIEGGRESFDGHFTVTPDAATVAAYSSNITYVWKQFRNAYQDTLTYTDETAWAANKPHVLSFKVSSTGADVAKDDWTYAKSISSDYTVVYGDTVTENITKDEYDALDATEQAKCTYNGDAEKTYSYTHVVSYTPVTTGQEYTVYHMGEYGDITDGTTYNASGTSSTTTGANADNTYQCTVTATDDAWVTFLAATDRTSQYSEDVIAQATKDYPASFSDSLAVRLKKNIVVWLHPNSTDVEYGIPAGKDDWTDEEIGDGAVGDKDHPVRTWGKAYSLLDGAEGVGWDFNKIVLVGTSDALTTNGFGSSLGEGEHGNGTGKTYSLGQVSWYGLSNVFSEGTTGLQKTSSAPSYDVYMADIARSPMAKNVTITGKYDGVDYNGAITSPQIKSYDKEICGADVGKVVQRWFNMLGDTKFEYLTFNGCKDASYDSFFGHYHDIWFGEGLIMKDFCGDNSGYGTIATVSTPRFDIWGGIHNDERFSLYDGKNGELLRMQEKFMPHGKKGFTMTFRSGYYSIICTGSRETESVGIQGSPNMPIKCTVDVDLDQSWNNQGENPKTMSNATSTPYDVGIILSGNHEGPMFADIDISVRSGRVARVVNGSLGANTPSSYIYGNGKLSYPYNNFMGRTNMVLDPAKSRFATAGEDAATTNARVLVTEVYNGSIGRSWADSKQEIDMASLGDFKITMNGGTIGFPHTTTYWDDTDLTKLKESNQVVCGIYGGGAGGMIGIGYGDYDDTDKTFLKPHSYTKEQFLPYWDSKDHLCPYYSPYSIYKQYIAKTDSRHLFIHCYNATTDDYTEVDPADTKSVITINGGVIGSAEKPANIFGAGSGFTSTWFLRQSNYPNLTSGTVYGTSKEDTVVTLNIKGNTVIYGNVYGAGKGTDYYYTHYRTATQVYSGDNSTAQNFTFLGQTYGSAVVNISDSAVIHGNVYGGGAGVAEAKFIGSTDTYTQMTQTALLTGNTSVNISGNAKIKTYNVTTGAGDDVVTKTYGGNVYGGGMLALVDGTTNVNISDSVLVEGSVYGGAQGIDNTTNAEDSPQTISGTKEETYNLYNADNAKMFGVFNGTINVNVSGSPFIHGDIYGGSQCAVINGYTNVKIDGGTIGKSDDAITEADKANKTYGGNIYGGGHGVVDTDGTVKASADVSYNTAVKVNKVTYGSSAAPYYIYGGGNKACKVGNAATVNLTNVLSHTGQTTVFGAGCGKNTTCESSAVTINKFTQPDDDTNLYGYGNLYGGGNMGTVRTMSKVTMYGGIILGDVFGGGNEATVGTITSEITQADKENKTQFGSQVFVGISRGGKNAESCTIYGTIFGGGNAADVYGSTKVNLNAGYFAGDVFGGGNGALGDDNVPIHYADVTDSTRVYTYGAAVLWDKKWKSNTTDDNGFITTPGTIEGWDGTWSGENRDDFLKGTEQSPVFITSHNIYGGGNKACRVSGIANIEVMTGFADSTLITKDIWKNSFDDRDNPHCYVFGGGYGAFTSVGSTLVNVSVAGKWDYWNAEVDDNLAKPGLGALDDDASTPGSGASKASRKSVGTTSRKGRRKSYSSDDDNGGHMGIYSNEYGIPMFTVLGVLGGGYGGVVLDTTNVTVTGTTFVNRVYGGGFGSKAEYNKVSDDEVICPGYLTGSIINTDLKRKDLGRVLGSTKVQLPGAYVYGDVFGGGAGVESSYVNEYGEIVMDGTKSGTLTDFADMASVYKTTKVIVSNEAKVFGSVYGGGDVANVLGEGIDETDTVSMVTVKDSPVSEGVNIPVIYQDVYAGGNGRVAASCADYTTLGKISGKTQANILGGKIWRNIYGGCAYGTVTDSAYVYIRGGEIGNDIFGAGSGDYDEYAEEGKRETSADVKGNTRITVTGGSYLWKQISDKDGNKKSLTDDNTSDIPLRDVQLILAGDTTTLNKYKAFASDIFDFDNKLLIGTDSVSDTYRDHNIYGGGNICSKVGTYNDAGELTAGTGHATVDVQHTLFTDNLVAHSDTASTYAYADAAKWSMGALCCYMLLDHNEHPQIGVLGGGYGIRTTVGSTDVSIDVGGGATGPGYTAIKAIVNEYEGVSSEDKNKYYGGTTGSNGAFRYTLSRMAKMLVVPNASLLYVAGGGFAGNVVGDTKVDVGDNTMCSTVFGGGIGIEPTVKLSSQEAANALTYGQVGGNTEVSISNGIVRHDVFGGGSGIAPLKVDVDGNILADQTAEGTYRDFPNIARVLGTTKVTTKGQPNSMCVYGHVYGGGDAANVGADTDSENTKYSSADTTALNDAEDTTIPYRSQVFITGGNVMKEVFAGGSGRGRSECHDYTGIGAVYGNTRLVIKNTETTQPWLWNSIYGGGEKGTVYGNTNVQILGGNYGYNLFAGGLGDVSDSIVVSGVKTVDADKISSADVKGSANINIPGGAWIISQVWNPTTSTWYPSNKNVTTGEYYSAQYDYTNKKFLINHNIYGGGNAAGRVGGDAYITMTHGMIDGRASLGHDYSDADAAAVDQDKQAFFKSAEWKAVYNKIGTSHFCLYGGGYGEKTSVGNTYVNVNMAGNHTLAAGDIETSSDVKKEDLSDVFYGNQSLMDIIGGGYQGEVRDTTHVTIDGNTYIRRAYGGSYYADITRTRMNINSVKADDVFGGSIMGDVNENVNLTVGTVGTVAAPSNNIGKIFITNNIYGGNDVSGSIKGKINLNVNGGKVYGNIYGAGNGNYLYAFTTSDMQTKVRPDEDYVDSKANSYDQVVYVVPAINYKNRKLYGDDFFIEGMGDVSSSAKLVDIAQFRPKAEKADITISGQGADDCLTVLGSFFGGGNTASFTKVNASGSAAVNVNIGSHVKLSAAYMGADGAALFDESNKFMEYFNTINGIDLNDTLDWVHYPDLTAISTTYIPVEIDDRPKVYKHNLDLYFMPVEMSVQPHLTWAGSTDGQSLEDCTIGAFVCGGNRGNMNVTPDNTGNIVDYIFPAGLTITDRIVGGCNEANYTITSTEKKHEGGYLLGERTNGSSKYTSPAIKLLVKCNFQKPDGEPSSWKDNHLNVYGGCYHTGTIKGDVEIDFRSKMLTSMSQDDIDNLAAHAEDYAIGNVYGAGYGSDSYIYGNTKVYVGAPMTLAALSKESGTGETMDPKGVRKAVVNNGDESVVAMSVYGGGQEGHVIGNTFVQILNGHIGKDVVGGSYSGNIWGSTHVLVGYPKYYKCNSTGIYLMKRTDKWNADSVNADGSRVVKDTIFILKDDMISQDVYGAIKEYDTEHSTSQATGTNFTETSTTPGDYGNVWDKTAASSDSINITIDQAVYGGGYSILNGATGSGTYTVKKLDDEQNMDDSYTSAQLATTFSNNGSTTKGYGGNTTVLVWDQPTDASTKDHITISKQKMALADNLLKAGDDLFSYYYKDTTDNYRYIYMEGEYKYKGTLPDDVSKTDTHIYMYDGEGGLFGDGHYSFAEGFRSGDVKGYGFAGRTPNNGKILNSLQRMDMIRVTDCAMVLLGARDFTVTEISSTPYSISRVGEIYMYNENVAMDSGKLYTKLNVKKCRNYIGVSNNVHYIGAIRSNVEMTSPCYNDNGEQWTGNLTYRQVKQDFIDKYHATEKNKANSGNFQKRNNARAKNMIGISSGYALKIQNYVAKSDTIKTIRQEEVSFTTNQNETSFWGPIVGVVEMQLLNVRPGEAGGYVYADNIHHRKAASSSKSTTAVNTTDTEVPETHEGEEDFLETSGNFVFPYDTQRKRYIIDDCFRTSYDAANGHDDSTGEPADEAHYWFVNGTTYYYNAHITGYTYKKTTQNPAMTFGIDNSDGILRLSNTIGGTQVTLKSITWRSNHADGYQCDLQTRNTDLDNKDTNLDSSGKSVYNRYHLYIGSGTTENNADGVKTATKLQFLADSIVGNIKDSLLDLRTNSNSDNIVMQIVDSVDNSTTEYYNDHLSKPCLATIVMTAPVMEVVNNDTIPSVGKVDVTDFYTRSGSEGAYTYEKVTGEGECLSEDLYYNYADNWIELKKDSVYIYKSDKEDYDPVTDLSTCFISSNNSYGISTKLINTYYIYLTIDYLEGPNVTGNIKVENCALPGEYIRISPNTVQVTADVSMSQNGTIWRIGKIADDSESFDYPYYEYNQESKKAYEVTDKDTKTVTSLLSDVRTVTIDNRKNLLLPAFYFMNGYGVQYCYTVNSIDDQVFDAPLLASNYITIHNYHRMLPRKDGLHAKNGSSEDIDLYIEKAAQRHASDISFPEPRVYLYDDLDLNTFGQFVNAKSGQRAAEVNSSSVAGDGTKTNYGENIQFFLMSNITAQKGSHDAGNVVSAYQKIKPLHFNGTFNGMGHVISGLGSNSLFTALNTTDADHAANSAITACADGGNVYNLGLSTGVITPGDASTTSNAKYHCCYEFNPGDKSVSGASTSSLGSYIYRMDGTAYSGYNDADWRYGKVAYDLNQYYLDARYASYSDSSNPRDPGSSGYSSKSSAGGYVENIYKNGDYLYAYQYNAETAPEYLRTQSNTDAHYLADYSDENTATFTYHNTAHTKDKYRLLNTELSGYQPLLNQQKANGTTDSTAVVLNVVDSKYRNDYIFFGQSLTKATVTTNLGTTGVTSPTVIAGGGSHTINQFTNRVYRAGGYYRSTANSGYYYNPSAYIYENDITAIDFHGWTHTDYTKEGADNSHVGTPPDADVVYYAPLADYGLTEVAGIGDNVTRNLLVYGNNDAVLNEYNYESGRKESNIRMHVVLPNGSNAERANLHLVERTSDNENSEGGDCPNNDFCCPIAFDVTTRAWYTRLPRYYAESSNTAWDGICLPFSANRVEASYNGEISHFYGAKSDGAANKETDTDGVYGNNTNTGHEYWLRGLTAVDDGNGSCKGSFKRPGAASSDGDTFTGGGLRGTYNYSNTHFADVYGSYYSDGDIYAKGRVYNDYYFLQQSVPYIVSFPGSRYKEFDLSGKFNKALMNDTHGEWDADTDKHSFNNLSTDNQKVTFSWYADNVDDDSNQKTSGYLSNNANVKAVVADGKTTYKITIPVTTEMKTTVSSYAHVGTFLSDDATYGMNSNGTAFDDEVTSVLPFRTYMTTVASSAKRVGKVLIYEDTGIEEVPQEDEEGNGDTPNLTIYTKDHSIVIESTYDTTLRLYTTAGQLVRSLDVTAGTNTYDGIQQGIYIVGRKKVYVR